MTDAPRAEVWVGLLDPDGKECQAADYNRARMVLVNGRSLEPVSFPIASSDWGEFRHFAIFASPHGENALMVGQLTSAIVISPGITANMERLEIQGDKLDALPRTNPPEPITAMTAEQRTQLRTKAQRALAALHAAGEAPQASKEKNR